jgi:hypothetical protein
MPITDKEISSIIFLPTYRYQRDLMDLREVRKLEQAAIAHGYRGASKGKHNGVVNIKPDDKILLKSLEKFKSNEGNKNFLMGMRTLESEEFYIDVKVVAHCQNGDRIVGFLNRNKSGELILYLLGFSNYNYEIFK